MIYKNGRAVNLNDQVVGKPDEFVANVGGIVCGLIPASEGKPEKISVMIGIVQVAATAERAGSYHYAQAFGESKNFIHADDLKDALPVRVQHLLDAKPYV